MGGQAFSYQAPLLWNQLPVQAKAAGAQKHDRLTALRHPVGNCLQTLATGAGIVVDQEDPRSHCTSLPSSVLVFCGSGRPLRFPSFVLSWRAASVPEFRVALEGRICSRVSCGPGGPFLFPGARQSWRAALVFLVLQFPPRGWSSRSLKELPSAVRVSCRGWDVLFNMDDSLAIILPFPTTSTKSRGHPRTELALLDSLSILFYAAGPSDYPIKDGRSHHRVIESPQEWSLHSKRPQPPEQEQSAIALLDKGVCVVCPVQIHYQLLGFTTIDVEVVPQAPVHKDLKLTACGHHGGERQLDRVEQETRSQSVVEVALAVGQEISHRSVKAAARMNRAMVLFPEKVEQANRLVETGITVEGKFVQVTPLTQLAARITLSNMPLFVSDEFLAKKLSRHGKLVSPIRKVLAEAFNYPFDVRVDDFDYIATSSALKYFNCGKEGHLARACPSRLVPDAAAPAAGSAASEPDLAAPRPISHGAECNVDCRLGAVLARDWPGVYTCGQSVDSLAL
ncbi:hypothetical protein D4764_0016330, partial [Takifugu flavidus]